MGSPRTRNIRSVAEAKNRFEERYGAEQNRATVALEREVIGGDYGANSYTTREQADILIERLQLKRNQRLLDIGAGRGWPGLYLSKRSGCQVVLTDLPVVALREASRRVSAFMDSIGLPDVTFMTLRHTAATWGWHGVRSWGLVSRYLGHSEAQSMTAGYVHLDWETLKPIGVALDLFDSGIDPRVANQTATQGSDAKHAHPGQAEVPAG